MKFEIPEQYRHSSGIYSITNLVNGKRLIGQTVDFRARFNGYLTTLAREVYNNVHFQNAYNKYGTDSFKMELICQCKENLNEMEDYYCRAFNTLDHNFGYNEQQPIRQGKYRYSESARKRMSDSHKGVKLSEEHKRKLSEAMMGNKRCLGNKLSEEHKRKLSEAGVGNKNALGFKHTEEAKKKISEAHKGNKYRLGHKLTEEHKRKLSEACKGNKFTLGNKLTEERKKQISEFFKGRIFSEETKRKISEANKGKNKGRIVSVETRKKLAAAGKGRKLSEETIRKRTEARKRNFIEKKNRQEQGILANEI